MDDNVDKGKEYDILFNSSNKHLFCKNNLLTTPWHKNAMYELHNIY